MKKFLLGTVGLIALGMAAPASAADMAVKAAPAPYVAPIYNWTGFYIGGNGGWGQSNSCLNFVDGFGIFDFADGCALAVRRCRRRPDRLPLAGQPMGVWLGSTGRLGGSQPHAPQPVFRSVCRPGFISTRTKTDGIGLFTGQIGYAWNAALFYVKGGAAVTSNRFSILETFTGIELASASATRWGGTVGVGFEYGFTPNWSFGVEYNHLFMGDANNSFTGVNLVTAAVLNNRITQDVDMVTLRINYRFGGYGAPGRSEILISRYFDFSSKLGRQKCRPFCWRLHV